MAAEARLSLAALGGGGEELLLVLPVLPVLPVLLVLALMALVPSGSSKTTFRSSKGQFFHRQSRQRRAMSTNRGRCSLHSPAPTAEAVVVSRER